MFLPLHRFIFRIQSLTLFLFSLKSKICLQLLTSMHSSACQWNSIIIYCRTSSKAWGPKPCKGPSTQTDPPFSYWYKVGDTGQEIFHMYILSQFKADHWRGLAQGTSKLYHWHLVMSFNFWWDPRAEGANFYLRVPCFPSLEINGWGSMPIKAHDAQCPSPTSPVSPQTAWGMCFIKQIESSGWWADGLSSINASPSTLCATPWHGTLHARVLAIGAPPVSPVQGPSGSNLIQLP